MNRLPDTRGAKSEVITMVRSQRNFYDHAVRTTYAYCGSRTRIVTRELVRDAEPWESRMLSVSRQRRGVMWRTSGHSRAAEVVAWPTMPVSR
jgi:hypothetical protein